jgi:glutathione S-transferase
MRLYDYAASGNCYKVRLLLALLDRPYERVPIDIFAGDTLTREFGALNPVRETPVLELDVGELLTQSNAILWYLGEGTASRQFVVGAHCSIADVSLFAYTHVAGDAGFDLDAHPAVRSWIGRIEAQPGFMNDLVPYPANARPGAGRSIYD